MTSTVGTYAGRAYFYTVSITTSPSCLEALVGLRRACETPDPAALYLDTLGLSELELRDYLTAAHSDVAALFRDCRTVAIQSTAARIESYLRRLYRPASLVDSVRVGHYASTFGYEPLLAGTLGGYTLTLDRPDSYLTLSIPTVSLQVETTMPVDLYLYDLDEGALLATTQIDCVADQVVTQAVHWTVTADRRRRRLFVGYDRDAVRGVTATLNPGRSSSGCSTCTRSSYRPWPGLDAQVATVPLGSPTWANVTTANKAAGLSLVTSVTCDHAGWLCSLSASLALPLAYATAREIYDRALRTTFADRLTPRTTDPERLRELRAEYATLADGLLTQLLGSVPPPQDDLCYLCERKLHTIISLP